MITDQGMALELDKISNQYAWNNENRVIHAWSTIGFKINFVILIQIVILLRIIGLRPTTMTQLVFLYPYHIQFTSQNDFAVEKVI